MPQLLPVSLAAQHIADNPDFPVNSVPKAPRASELRDAAQENYVLTASLAAKLGFELGDVGSSIKHQVLLFGTSRWKDVEANGHTFRFGTAVRAMIVVTDLDVRGGITLPLLAAKVQLGQATASAQIMVRGYRGSLKLPRWESFDVTTHAKYQKCVSDLQNKVLFDEAKIDPELLGTTAADPGIPPIVPSLGLIYAVSSIAHKHSLLDALEHLHAEDDMLRRIVRQVYTARVGEDERAKPGADVIHTARADLEGYELNRDISALVHR